MEYEKMTVVGTLEAVPKNLEKRLEIRGRIDFHRPISLQFLILTTLQPVYNMVGCLGFMAYQPL